MTKHLKLSNLKERLKTNSLGLRLLIGLCMVLSIATFLHLRHVRVEVFSVHEQVNNLIIGQIDLLYPEEQTTLVFKEEALDKPGDIFELNDAQLRDILIKFEEYLVLQKSAFNKENAILIAHAFQDILSELRFTSLDTYKKMELIGFPSYHYMVWTPTSEDEPITLPPEYWRGLKSVSLENLLNEEIGTEYDSALSSFVIDYFLLQNLVLVHDKTSEKAFKKALQKEAVGEFSRLQLIGRILAEQKKLPARQQLLVQAIKDAVQDTRSPYSFIPIAGDLLLALLLVCIGAFYFYIMQSDLLLSKRKIGLLFCIMTFTFLFAKVIEYIFLQSQSGVMDIARYPLIVPFAAVLLCFLFNARVALFMAAYLSVIVGVSIAGDHSRFIVANLLISTLAIALSSDIRKRRQVFFLFGQLFAVCVILVFANSYINNVSYNAFLTMDLITVFVFAVLNAILVIALLPGLEFVFNVMTDITLLEYIDPTSKIMRRLTMEIPGTYQHSLAMGNLAESAAQAIGANGIFCRVASYFHDIGKLKHALSFTENQALQSNLHDQLTPEESAKLIIDHVKDGKLIALKYQLPQSVIDIISQHHGTSIATYFYLKEVERHGGDVEKVNKELYRYPGPKPQTKEAAILMIADIIEAASRSLTECNEQTITALAEKLISEKAADGQFDECPLTFKELEIAKKTMISTILISRHVRVKYPDQK